MFSSSFCPSIWQKTCDMTAARMYWGAVWLEQVSLKERKGPAACPIKPATEGWSFLISHSPAFEVHSQKSIMELQCLLKVK